MRFAPALLYLASTLLFAEGELAVLKGGKVAASLDLNGFKLDLGAENLHDNYFRLGQFSSTPELSKALGGRLIGSLLVDDLPQESDKKPLVDPMKLGLTSGMRAMFMNFLKSSAVPDPVFTFQKIASPTGILYSYQEVHDINGKNLHQFQIYFETIQAGKWIEFHFSVPTDQPLSDAAPFLAKAKALIASLKVEPLTTK